MRFAALSLVVLAAACKPAAPTLDPHAEVIARQFFEEIRNGDDLDADTHLAHELKNPTTEAQIAQFRTLIPQDPPRSIELRTWDAKTDSVVANSLSDCWGGSQINSQP